MSDAKLVLVVQRRTKVDAPSTGLYSAQWGGIESSYNLETMLEIVLEAAEFDAVRLALVQAIGDRINRSSW